MLFYNTKRNNVTLKKTLKIVTGVIVFFTLPSILFFGFVYFKYNKDIPYGIVGKEADSLAYKMLDALHFKNFKNTNYIEWTYNKQHHYEWNKKEKRCNVYWKEYKVDLDLNNHSQSQAYIHGFKVDNDLAYEIIEKAKTYFHNDTFWLVGPYNILDEDVERKLVILENNNNALLTKYSSGDSYLWILDETFKPKAINMWTSRLPIDGIEASWSDWTKTSSGAKLPTFHKLLFIGFELEIIKGI